MILTYVFALGYFMALFVLMYIYIIIYLIESLSENRRKKIFFENNIKEDKELLLIHKYDAFVKYNIK